MHGSTCNPNPLPTGTETDVKPERGIGRNLGGQGKFRSRHFIGTVAGYSAIPSPYFYQMIHEDMRNKETHLFRKPQGFRTIRFHFTAEAIEWLAGTTNDNEGNAIDNHTLFCDLLSRIRLTSGRDDSFRRPQELQPGQFQFSETGLAEEWNTGRKKVRNLLATMERLGLIAVNASKVASVASVTCIRGWTDTRGDHVRNPFATVPDGI